MQAARVGMLAAAVTVVLGAAYVLYGPHHAGNVQIRRDPAPVVSSLPQSAQTLVDPLSPGRPVTIDSARVSNVTDWTKARPAFQYSHSAAERGGVEPCATQKVDTSAFEDWAPLSQGRFSAPRQMSLDPTGHFDLVIHLHGDEPVRRELLQSGQHFVLYTLTLAPDQSYAPLFSGSQLYQAIRAGIEQAISKRTGTPAHVGHVALSAWSAGFVGIEAALAQPESRDVDAVLLVDGLHAPRGNDFAFKAQLDPFLKYAERAATGDRFFFVSHSSIDPPGFASTTECAHYLIAALGGTPEPVRRTDAFGLELVESFSRGSFNVRGYAGNDKADHCAQLAVLRDVFAALGRRWASSPGSAPDSRVPG